MGFGDMFSRSMDPPPQGGAPQRSHKTAVWLFAVAVVLAGTAVTGGLGYYYFYRPVYLRIAVGPPNSEDVKVIQSIAQIFARDRQRVRLRPVVTEGAVASAENLSAGTVDLAVVRGDLDLPKEAQAVAGIRKNYAVLWAPGKKGGVKKIEQLAGKRVGVIGRTQANVNLLRVMLTQSGVKPDSVHVVQFPAIGFADSIKNEKLDAFLAVGPLNSKITAEAINLTTREGKDAVFLTLDIADAVAQKFPRYDSGEIPAGTFGAKPPRPADKIDTIVFSHHIVANRTLSETTVSTLTRQLFAVRQQIQAEFPMGAKLETPDTDKAAAIPVHPGAAAYVDGDEKSFLDRYSDFIWGGLMVLSALGSAGAWFASYLRRDEREINTTQRERLLEMLTAARKSASMDELDAMQAEADDILRDTLHCFEDGAIEEGSLTAFSIALEQFHNAVADRKTVLLEMPEPPAKHHKAHPHVA
jgi:TRAP transporter TAXI family solute receptor